MNDTISHVDSRQAIIDACATGTGLMLVRKAAGREVYRLTVSEETYYVKAMFYTKNIIRNTLIKVKAIHEYYHHCALAEKGVPLPEMLGWAKVRMHTGCDAAILVTRAIQGAEVLDQIDEIWHDDHIRRIFFSSLAGFLAENYRNNVIHKDLHLGNIIWEKPKNRLVFVDPRQIVVRKRLSVRQICANIAMLYCAMYPKQHFTDSIWREFLDLLFEQYGFEQPFDQYHALVDIFVRKHFRRWINKRTERAFRQNTDFGQIHEGSLAGMVRHRFNDFFSQNCAGKHYGEYLDKLFASSATDYLKNSNTTAVARVVIGDIPVVIKKFKVKRCFDPLKNIVRASRGWRSWYWGWRLTLQKVPVAQPQFYAEVRRFGLLYENYYAAGDIPQACNAMEYLDKHGRGMTTAQKRLFLRRLAELHNALLGAGAHHHDFQLKNILVKEIHDAGTCDYHLYVIDLEAVAHQLKSKQAVAKDHLSQLRKSYLRLNDTGMLTVKDAVFFIKSIDDSANSQKQIIKEPLKNSKH